jgi:TonB-linked SusC/RagA family outer membrane protein
MKQMQKIKTTAVMLLALLLLMSVPSAQAQRDTTSMPPDSAVLDRIVVTALGISKDKKILGFATQKIKGADLIKAREPNAINSLAGKVAGLTIGASAELFGSPQVILRGSDINRGQSVLYVVDGVPVNSDVWNLSPDDIESYTVLKGPAAAALYGYRGQNGAILISTKKANTRKEGLSISVNSSNMVERGFLTIPEVQDEYGPGDHGKYSFGDGKGGGLNDGDYDVWGPKFEGQMIQQYDGLKPWTARGKDNLRRFLQPGMLNTNNFAISYNSDKADLRFSYTNFNQTGIVPNTRIGSNNFSLSNNVRFSDKLRLSSFINYSNQYSPNIPDIVYGPNSVIYNMIIWNGADWDVMADDIRGIWKPGREGVESIHAEYQRYHNPWFMSYKWLRGHSKNDMYGYAALTYDFTDNLNAMLRTGFTTYDVLRTEKLPFSAHPYGREENRGDYREDRRSLFERNTDLIVTYEMPSKGAISMRVIGGGNIRNFRYNSNFTTTDYLNVPEVYNFSNSANPVKAFNFNSEMYVGSVFGMIDLGFGKYANLNITGRNDNLSTFNPDNSSYFYPSASLSTVLTDYLKLPEFVSFFKLRASYANVKGGLTNPMIGPAGYPIGYGTPYSTTYDGPSFANSSVYSTPLVYNGRPAAYFTNLLSNPNLQPFSRTNIEYGTDIRLFKDRFGVEATYFVYNDGPGIFQRTVSEASGYTSALVNGIETQRKGWEITLDGQILKSKKGNRGISWNSTINLSRYREVLKSIYKSDSLLSSNFFVGDNQSNRFIKIGDRIDAIYHGAFARTNDGQIINDAGGRPIVLPKGQLLGYALPDLVWGFTNRIGYKNFSVSFQFDGRIGGSIVNQIQRQTFRGGRHIATVENEMTDRNGLGMGDARYQDYLGNKAWVGEGVKIVSGTPKFDPVTGQITNMDDLKFADNDTKTYLQDYISRYYGTYEPNVMSKSFMKLREITFSYNLPSSMFKNSKIAGASISLVTRNLLYFAKLKDIDLDQFAGLQAYSGLQTPTTRRYGINLNITF